VITAEDIRRSGVTTIPQALRLAPGVEVARNGSNEWTISIRGFSSDLSNKLLVLIDGRSVYSPLFAGVFWDVQDTLLADIERIEIVSGPGGAVWGANAVNGVINIITNAARDTQGGFAELVGGNEEEAIAAVRYGWKPGEKLYARAYVKTFERHEAELISSGRGAHDGWEMSRAGFALTWEATAQDLVNVRADAYDGEEDALLRGNFTLGTLPALDVPGVVPLSGRSVFATWRRALRPDANWRVQFYYDQTDREIPGSFNEARDTYDLAFQHDLANYGRHDAQWGAELKSTSDDIGNTQFSSFIPASRTDQTASMFVQDRIELQEERLYLTLGAKLEHNDYTGFEQQPNVRVTWLPGDRQTIWGAASRAVRVPARLNTDVMLFAPVALPGLPPLYINVNGDPEFDSEELDAYEAGYRLQVNENLSLDVAVFDNYYDHLQTNEALTGIVPVTGPPPYLLLSARLGNLMEGETYGGTAVVTWQPLSRWRLQFQVSSLEMDLRTKPGGTDANSPIMLSGNSPKNLAAVQSYVELPNDLSLYTSVRHVDALPAQRVPSYDAVDVSLGWRPTERLRTSLTVQNVNDAKRVEFNDGRRIERSAFARVQWTF
jgi:iron complex outermembrane receptor protein